MTQFIWRNKVRYCVFIEISEYALMELIFSRHIQVWEKKSHIQRAEVIYTV